MHERFFILSAMNKPKNKHAVALGHKGGIKGGKSRWAKLSPSEKTDLARKMALARWSKNKP